GAGHWRGRRPPFRMSPQAARSDYFYDHSAQGAPGATPYDAPSSGGFIINCASTLHQKRGFRRGLAITGEGKMKATRARAYLRNGAGLALVLAATPALANVGQAAGAAPTPET